MLFDLAIDDIIDELEDTDIKTACGYKVNDGVVSVLSFADHTAVAGKDRQSVQRLVDIASSGFARCGLCRNVSKTHWLAIFRDRPYYEAYVVYSDEVLIYENANQLIGDDEEPTMFTA